MSPQRSAWGLAEAVAGRSTRAVMRRFPHVVELRTAVLWWKACSVFEPDYYVEYLPESPWIRQPFEVYDDLDPNRLAERLAARGVAADEVRDGREDCRAPAPGARRGSAQ